MNQTPEPSERYARSLHDWESIHAFMHASRERVKSIQQRGAQPGAADGAFHEVFEELNVALEELSVTEEELRAQNDSLRAAVETIDRERQEFQSLFDHAPIGFLVTSRTGSILRANRAAAQLLDTEPHWLIRKPIAVFVDETQRRDFRAWTNRLRPNHLADRELSIARKDREPRTVVLRAQPDTDGELIRWLMLDMTESREALLNAERLEHERQARAAAEASARRLRLLAETGRALLEVGGTDRLDRFVGVIVRLLCEHCTVYLYDGDRLVCAAQQASSPGSERVAALLARRFALDPDNTEGPLWAALRSQDFAVFPELGGEAGSPGRSKLLAAARTEGPRTGAIIPLEASSGALGVVVLLSTTAPPRLGAEDIAVAIEACGRLALVIENDRLHDVTREANEGKARFLAMVSHELRTPLTTVIGYAELLAAGVPEPLTPRTEKAVQRILAAALHQRSLVEQMIAYTRADAAQEQLRSEPVDLACLVQDVLDAVRPAADEKGLLLEGSLPEQPMSIRSDPDRVRQVVLNLANNAVRYTESGSVLVEVVPAGDHVLVRVTDTGPGIAPRDLERVFEPFWQAHTGAPNKGLGLGLAICRRIADALGGTITAESEPGAGTRFTLRLPVEPPA